MILSFQRRAQFIINSIVVQVLILFLDRSYLEKALTIAELRKPGRDDGTMARILWKTSVVIDDDVVEGGKEAEPMALRADVALREFNGAGEGALMVAIDEDGIA